MGGPNDYAATIPVKTSAGTGRVPFPRNGPTVGGISRNISDPTEILRERYRLLWDHCVEKERGRACTGWYGVVAA